MEFSEFVESKRTIMTDRPGVAQLCETRVGRAFKAIRPGIAIPDHFDFIRNEELAGAWCRARALPSELARRTLICKGVRQALELLLTSAARSKGRVALPSDVYPAYLNIARRAGVDTITFETFPVFDVESVLHCSSRAGAEIVLLPTPLVLHGRDWTESEATCAAEWLQADARRRLYLDGVYSLGLPIKPSAKTLIETGQVIYLDSLSKGWASDLTLGFACFPQSDLSAYATDFARLRVLQESLFVARGLLCDFHWLPARMSAEIDARRVDWLGKFQLWGFRTLPSAQGYFVGIEESASKLLDLQNLLVFPVSVFGCPLTRWSIASMLPIAPE